MDTYEDFKKRFNNHKKYVRKILLERNGLFPDNGGSIPIDPEIAPLVGLVNQLDFVAPISSCGGHFFHKKYNSMENECRFFSGWLDLVLLPGEESSDYKLRLNNALKEYEGCAIFERPLNNKAFSERPDIYTDNPLFRNQEIEIKFQKLDFDLQINKEMSLKEATERDSVQKMIIKSLCDFNQRYLAN